MNRFKKIVYIILAMMILVVILLLLVVHTFNHTEVNNDSGIVYVKPLKEYPYPLELHYNKDISLVDGEIVKSPTLYVIEFGAVFNAPFVHSSSRSRMKLKS